MSWPETVSTEEMQRRLPMPITKAMMFILLGSATGGRMYKRENGEWRLVDDQVYAGDNLPPWKVRHDP
jgi:hypothetical protein